MAGKKRTYRRSTPVLRLRRTAEKVVYYNSLGLGRLRSWQVAQNELVDRCLAVATVIAEKSVLLGDLLLGLESSGFVPPKRWQSYQPEVGHRVRIADRFRPRYEQLYERQIKRDPEMLDDMVVVKVVPSGEVAVQRGRHTPIVSRKTHLCPLKEDP
jgi:hypothetical protein